MFEIAKWYNNYQSPAVLMIDDLSDAYIDVYDKNYMNDWGYLCNKDESSYVFLKKELLNKFPNIKITFFVPYSKHNVINVNSKFKYKKYAIGERYEFIEFLKILVNSGHEIAHHGSNHGKYIDEKKVTTVNNWIHEWALFDKVEIGVMTTLKGVKIFKNVCNIDIAGGKYCGYVIKENSQEIIDKCNFLYWCDKPSYNISQYNEGFFGKNNIISFPTNYAGNSFVRLTYLSGDKQRDIKKNIFKYFQPIYSFYSYIRLYRLYMSGHIISIQEHYSPSTTAGTVQSANIVTDIKSLNKIFSFLNNLSIWYATCVQIAEYIYVRENTNLNIKNNQLIINIKLNKKISEHIVTVANKFFFKLSKSNLIIEAIENNGLYVVNLLLKDEITVYTIIKD